MFKCITISYIAVVTDSFLFAHVILMGIVCECVFVFMPSFVCVFVLDCSRFFYIFLTN